MTEREKPGIISDGELDRLLAAATRPPDVSVAKSGLLERIANEEGKSNVIAFSRRPVPRPEPPSRLGWITGLPLAASLALGIYMGSSGTASEFLPDYAYEVLAGVALEESTTGIDEALTAAEDETT